MSSDQTAVEVIRAAWRVAPSPSGESGSIIALRQARADVDGLRDVVAALKRIEPAAELARELVAEVWGLPYYMSAFIQTGQFHGSLKEELLALQQECVVELHRILGTPRQIENAPPPTQANVRYRRFPAAGVSADQCLLCGAEAPMSLLGMLQKLGRLTVVANPRPRTRRRPPGPRRGLRDSVAERQAPGPRTRAATRAAWTPAIGHPLV